jgi:hypothetical protein
MVSQDRPDEVGATRCALSSSPWAAGSGRLRRVLDAARLLPLLPHHGAVLPGLARSTHKNVPCTDCHFEPGLQNTIKGKFEASSQAAKFITGTYGSKPHAQIHDVSCMRSGCHEKRILEGKVDWTVTTPKGNTVTIKFDTSRT